VIEKHFTLNRADGGVDSTFSMEPQEMAQLVLETGRAWQALGKVSYGATEAEKKSTQFRRSLYVVEDMKAGDAISKHNMRAIRPGKGMLPKHYEQLLGKKVITDITKGTPLSWDLLE
jgi:N-acetylneuraminate synthase